MCRTGMLPVQTTVVSLETPKVDEDKIRRDVRQRTFAWPDRYISTVHVSHIIAILADEARRMVGVDTASAVRIVNWIFDAPSQDDHYDNIRAAVILVNASYSCVIKQKSERKYYADMAMQTLTSLAHRLELPCAPKVRGTSTYYMYVSLLSNVSTSRAFRDVLKHCARRYGADSEQYHMVAHSDLASDHVQRGDLGMVKCVVGCTGWRWLDYMLWWSARNAHWHIVHWLIDNRPATANTVALEVFGRVVVAHPAEVAACLRKIRVVCLQLPSAEEVARIVAAEPSLSVLFR